MHFLGWFIKFYYFFVSYPSYPLHPKIVSAAEQPALDEKGVAIWHFHTALVALGLEANVPALAQ